MLSHFYDNLFYPRLANPKFYYSAHGRAGASTTSFFLAAHFAKLLRNPPAAENRNRKARAGKILPTLSFARPSAVEVFCHAKRSNQSEFCSKKVRALFSNCDQSRHFENFGVAFGDLARKKSCISELNRKVGINSNSVFGKANGGSNEAIHK